MREIRTRRATALAAVAVLGLCAAPACGRATSPVAGRRLLILGVDGLDPGLLRRFIAEGRLPSFAALAAAGTFLPLATSDPPQSPVAWSHFATGRPSAGHGIYDFVHRDAQTLAPYLSTSRVREPKHALDLFGWRLPLGSAHFELLRGGTAFWEVLAAAGVPAMVLKVPANFPPAPGDAAVLAGMGTPDLLGTYGTYQVFTDDPTLKGRELPAAIVHPLDFGGGRTARASLTGPANHHRPGGEPLAAPMEVVVTPERNAALVRLGPEARVLVPGEWSGFVRVAFDPGVLAGDIRGIVRLALVSLRPHVILYASPINIDPLDAAMPLSNPPSLARRLGEAVGPFYTQGMPEETKAFSAGVLDETLFLRQAELIFDEEKRLLDWGLSRFHRGFLFHYFSVVDQVSHVFFRSLEAAAPPAARRYADVLPRVYGWIDGALGQTLRRVGPDTDVLVISDHGFAPFRWKVNLNTWLLQNGYLALAPHPRPGPLGHVDWSRTQAYALGLNQIFVNVAGREREGVVAPDERARLVARLIRALEAWSDPETGSRVVTHARAVESGDYPERAPDIVVGFARGYRSSDESALGRPEKRALAPNQDRWSGDHCMDPATVPGVFVSRLPVAATQASLLDLAPTVLATFAVHPPPQMRGHALQFPSGRKEARP